MNKAIRKFAAGVMLMAALLTLVPAQLLTAFAATGTLTFSDPSTTVGDQVAVTMKITSADAQGLESSDVMLEYDASALEFVNGTNANGGAGSVKVVGSMESEGQKTFTFTLNFKALKAGDTAIRVTSQEVYDTASQAVSMSHVGSSAVKVQAASGASDNASLSSLEISPGTLSPAFSADVTSYTASVGGDVDKITVSAPAADGNASVSISGNEGLTAGENTVECVVTAEDGSTKKTYTITVTKTDGETGETESASDETSGADAESGNDWSGWTVADTFDAATLPEGFTATEMSYEGRQVQAGKDEIGNIILYMTDEDGNGDFFLYDELNGSLSPYVTVRMAEKTIIVLPPSEIPDDVSIPDGFAECTIDIGSHTVNGWIWKTDTSESPEYCVVYGQNQDGERNFYRYDQKEMTLQRYFQDPDGAQWREKYTQVAEDFNGLLKDYNTRGYLVVGLFAACILLVIAVIVLLVRKPKNPGGPDRGARRADRDDPAREGRQVSKKSASGGQERAQRADRAATVRAPRAEHSENPARTAPVTENRETAKEAKDLEIEDLDLLDLDGLDEQAAAKEEPETPERESAGEAKSRSEADIVSPQAGNRTRQQAAAAIGSLVSEKAPSPRPAVKSAADVEKDIAAMLAREADRAKKPAETEESSGQSAKERAEEDGLELIDLD